MQIHAEVVSHLVIVVQTYIGLVSRGVNGLQNREALNKLGSHWDGIYNYNLYSF
jgi:hypothetical protein